MPVHTLFFHTLFKIPSPLHLLFALSPAETTFTNIFVCTSQYAPRLIAPLIAEWKQTSHYRTQSASVLAAQCFLYIYPCSVRSCSWSRNLQQLVDRCLFLISATLKPLDCIGSIRDYMFAAVVLVSYQGNVSNPAAGAAPKISHFETTPHITTKVCF